MRNKPKKENKSFFNIAVIIVVLASLIASRDLFRPGYFSMHDDLQIGRLYEMELCFKDGQIPCRWVPDMGYSYGYPLYNYYPPFPYYLGMAFRAIGFSFIDSTKILFILGFLISGILMYLFGLELWGNWGGLVSAVLYLMAPYHSVDVYVRGAMNEFWAMAFLPGIFWAVLKIIKGKGINRRSVWWLALFTGLLLLSHNLMSFIFAPVIAIFALPLIIVRKEKIKEKIISLFLGGVFGVGLAAFFTLPVILEKKYAHVETMLMGYFNYLAHYVPIGKLLFTRYWGYGSSGWLQDAGMPFQVGFPHWPLAVAVFLVSAYLFLKKKIKIDIFFVFTFFLFLAHPRSVFIWKAFPVLDYLQFPWRFLTLVAFAISVLGGGAIYFLKEKKQFFLSLLLVVLTVALNYSFFRVEKTIQVTDNEKLFSAKGWNKLQTDAIFDYLPIYAKAPPGGPAPEEPEVKEGKAEIAEVRKGTNWYRFEAKVALKEKATVQLPVYDFPGWKVWVNHKLAKINHDNFLGLITINLEDGTSKVEAKLADTPARRIGNLLSLASWIIFIFFSAREILASKKKTK